MGQTLLPRQQVDQATMYYRGAWSSSTAYLLNDVVTLGNVTYVCISSNTNHTPPNATYWLPLGITGSGATLPTSPIEGELFLYEPTGRIVLMEYNGGAWYPIISFGTMTLYVDGTNGTDDTAHGTGTGTSAFKTVQYAINQIPGQVGGNVTINIAAGTYSETVIIQGKAFTGNYTITLLGTLTTLDSLSAASGSVQGATSTQGTVVAAPSTWTVNQRQNKLIKFTSGVNNNIWGLIDSNTTDTLTIVGTWSIGAPTAGDTFVVYDWGTTIKSITATSGQLGIIINNLSIGDGTVNGINSYYNSNVTVNMCNVKARAAATLFACVAAFLSSITVSLSYLYGSTNGERVFQVAGNSSIYISQSKIYLGNNSTGSGIYSTQSSHCSIRNGTIIDGGLYGCYVDLASDWIVDNTALGWIRIRNSGTGLFGGIGNIISPSNSIVYSGNTLNESFTEIYDTYVASQFDKSNATLANIAGLIATIRAGKKYRFRAVLFTVSNVASGIKCAIGGTATATSIIYESLTAQGGAVQTPGTSRATALGTAVSDITAVTAATVEIEGTIVVNAGGTLTVQFADNAGTNVSSVLVGSHFEVTSVP